MTVDPFSSLDFTNSFEEKLLLFGGQLEGVAFAFRRENRDLGPVSQWLTLDHNFPVFDRASYDLHGNILHRPRAQIEPSSSSALSSAFDFEADGLSEVVYADQNRLRVFDGVDGTVVFETEVGSATRLEYPIIADVDVDGKAEILVVANEALSGPNAGVFVYGTPSERWVPTRSLWNQYTYHITNILDDGTIPRAGRPTTGRSTTTTGRTC